MTFVISSLDDWMKTKHIQTELFQIDSFQIDAFQSAWATENEPTFHCEVQSNISQLLANLDCHNPSFLPNLSELEIDKNSQHLDFLPKL